MDGREFINVAKDLVRLRYEAAFRSAVGRAYYALFNSAAKFLSDLGFSVLQGPGQVKNCLFNSGVDQLVEFSHVLDELRRRRNQADYNMGSIEFQEQAKCALHVARAEMTIGLLADCTKEPLRSQIRNNIREYERKINS